MGLIDSHAHLTYPDFAGRVEEVLARCDAAGVERVITIGTTPSDVRRAIDLARRFPNRIHAAAGVHPHHAGEVGEEDIGQITELWRSPYVVACGEMGLDHHYDFAPRDKQQAVFEKQLEAARSLGKPIVIHSREALDDTVRLLRDHGYEDRSVVFHCFTGTAVEAETIARHGWRISFTGIVTFPKSDALQAIAKSYPADQLMVETDSPFLSPVPVRGKRPNEPAHVAYVAKFLAELRGTPYDELVEATERNTRLFFNLAGRDRA